MKKLLPPWNWIAAAALTIVVTADAHAQQMDCGRLLELMWQGGESPGIEIDAAKGTVRVSIARGYCEEPIATWSARTPPQPGGEPAPKPSPPAAETTPPAPGITVTPQESAKPTPQSVPEPSPEPVPPIRATAPAPPSPAPQPGASVAVPPPGVGCQIKVQDLWGSRIVEIDGVDYWLARAFTMDFDGVSGVDDVSFAFKALDGSERVVRYFVSPTAPTEAVGQTIKGIALTDDRLVRSLCFGDVTFRKPDFFGQDLGPKWIAIDKPDLAGQAQAKREGRPYEAKDGRKKSQSGQIAVSEPAPVWPWIVGGTVLVMVGAGVVLVRRRRQAKKKKKGDDEDEEEAEDDEDEDDEDEPEDVEDAKKGGMNTFLARFGFGGKKMKKRGDNDEADQADEREQGGDEGKPAKPSFMARLGFGGGKKKKAKGGKSDGGKEA